MLESYGVTIDPRTIVNELPPVGQALVAIARAAEELREYRERTGATTSVLVLDEPTVFLPEEELQFLFDLIREVVAQGSSVIFISHDLAAVRTIADRVTVLRDGKLAADVRIDGRRQRRADRRVHRRSGEVARTARARRPVPPRPGRSTGRVRRSSSCPGSPATACAASTSRWHPARSSGWPACSDRAPRRCPICCSVRNGRPPARSRDQRARRRLTRQQPASAVGMGFSFIPADRNRDGIAREIEIDRNMMSLVLRRFTAGGRLRNRRVRSTPANGPRTSTSGRAAPTSTPAR